MLHERFLRGLALSGAGVAIRVGAQELSYAEANRMALCWAGALTKAKAGTVGVLAAKGITAYVGILAGLYAGATVVPLRPDFPAARTQHMMDTAGVSAVVVDDKGLTALAGLRTDLLDLALFSRQPDGRINMPDVYRVGFGLGRMGGVKPIR